MKIPDAPEAPQPSFAEVSDSQWRALAARRIFFGHQSVGGNIMDGVQEVLADHPEIPLHVLSTPLLDSTSPPGLYHANVGHNGEPASKTSAFDETVTAAAPSVALLKFCYVDVEGGRDPDSLFAAYQRTVAALQARVPGVTIVHVTMPLTRRGGFRSTLLARLRGQPTTDDLNVIRNRYNALLRQAYVGKEPVFDLARIESTHKDGTRSFIMHKGDTVYTLAAENTTDGGHLTTAGGRAAAEAFLAVLATLEEPSRALP